MSTRICFDLNALHRVLLGQESVSGISRVIYELALALLEEADPSEFEIFLAVSCYPQFTPEVERWYAERCTDKDIAFLRPGHVAQCFYSILMRLKIYPYSGQFPGAVMPPLFSAQHELDLIHSPFWRMRVSPKCRAKRIMTVHDLVAIRHPEYFDKKLAEGARHHIEYAANSADHVICVSENTRTDFCGHFNFPEERTSVIPLAASTDLFVNTASDEEITLVRQRYGIPEGRYILSLATLEPRKNLNAVIEGYIRMLRETREQDVCLVIAGARGWKVEQALQSLEIAGECAGRIVLTGFVADEDVSALYSGATAFVYLSLYEGFGLPPLEAMQCGTPVICSNSSSLPEVVGSAAIQVNPRDLSAVAGAMFSLLSDTRLADELSDAGLGRAKRFTWSRCARQTLTTYRQVIRQEG